MPKRPPPPNQQRSEPLITPAVLTALIALLGTVIAACVSSPALVALINSTRAPVQAAPAPAQAAPAASSAAPTVSIEGPATAALGSKTFFTVVSQNAVRGVWSISGFTNEPVTVEPLGASHELFVEPINSSRAGDSFTLVFTVYDSAGNSAAAQHRFRIASP